MLVVDERRLPIGLRNLLLFYLSSGDNTLPSGKERSLVEGRRQAATFSFWVYENEVSPGPGFVGLWCWNASACSLMGFALSIASKDLPGKNANLSQPVVWWATRGHSSTNKPPASTSACGSQQKAVKTLCGCTPTASVQVMIGKKKNAPDEDEDTTGEVFSVRTDQIVSTKGAKKKLSVVKKICTHLQNNKSKDENVYCVSVLLQKMKDPTSKLDGSFEAVSMRHYVTILCFNSKSSGTVDKSQVLVTDNCVSGGYKWVDCETLRTDLSSWGYANVYAPLYVYFWTFTPDHKVALNKNLMAAKTDFLNVYKTAEDFKKNGITDYKPVEGQPSPWA